VRHSPATSRLGFLVRTPSNEPRLLARGINRLRTRMVCAQCEEQCGQRSCSAAPPSRRASGRHLRRPCQTCRRPSRGPTSLPLKRLARPLFLLKLTKLWQLLGKELYRWKLPGIPNFRGRPLQKRRVFVRTGSEFHSAQCLTSKGSRESVRFVSVSASAFDAAQ
jgi:hypothetical protein